MQACEERDIVVFDTETTGLDVFEDEIVQIAAVRMRKAKELLRPGGRLTVAFPYDRERVNTLSAIMPAGIARGLLSAEEEAAFWRELFEIDCICDNDGLYLISGTSKPSGKEMLL